MYTKVLETKEILASLFFYTVISVKGKVLLEVKEYC